MISPLVAALTLAATPITLDQVRQESRQNNPSRIAELDALRAAEQRKVARSPVLPQVRLTAGVQQTYIGPQARYDLRPIDERDPELGYEQVVVASRESSQGSFGLGLGVSQLLFDGGRWWNEIARATAAEEAAKGQAQEQRLTSEYEGMRRFYELFRAQRTAEVLEAAARRSAEQLDRARALFEAGRMQKNEALSAEVNLGNDRINVLRQHARLAGAKADLAVWIARDGSEDLVPVEPQVFAQTPPVAPVYEAALQTAHEGRPVLKALQSQARAASLAASAASGSFWPRISLEGSYQRGAPSTAFFFSAPGQQNTLAGGINLSWDLFNGFATEGQVKDLRHVQMTAELNASQAQRELSGDVLRSLKVLQLSLGMVDVARANREVAAKSVTLAEERFKAGAGSTLEVRDAQLKLTQSELAALESRIDVEIARANLERVMGTLGAGASP